jgi:phage tail-like protein
MSARDARYATNYTDKLSEIHNDFRFSVVIDQINYVMFTEFQLPTLNVQTDTWREGGQNTYVHKMPKNVELGTVRLKHGITTEMALLEWYFLVLQGNVKDAKRHMDVKLLDQLGKSVMVWSFYDAFPIKWTGPLLKTDATGIAIDEIEIAYHGFELTTGKQ